MGDASSESAALSELLGAHRRWFVLTGAGCSTASGIPAYRDERGRWAHAQPMQLSEFLSSAEARQRYWARSSVGYRRMQQARPNRAHAALARLEAAQRTQLLVTQNVDGLHQQAGSRRVLELHGTLALVQCLDCAHEMPRDQYQDELERLNPVAASPLGAIRPDGDAALADEQVRRFVVPTCERCSGTLKPAVTFFGESVLPARVEEAKLALDRADALLVVGSSLAVFSGYRFVKRAAAKGLPIAVVNRGATRATPLTRHRFSGDCGRLLSEALERLG